MQGMRVASPGRQRSVSRGRRVSFVENVQVVAPRRRRRARRSGAAANGPSNSGGEIALSMTELLGIVKLDAGKTEQGFTFPMTPGKMASSSGASHLRALSKIYERIMWNSVRFEYVGAVGTTAGGVVVLGYDYDSEPTPTDLTLQKVVGYSPNTQTSVWDKAMLTVNVAKFSEQRWMSTQSTSTADIGSLVCYATGATAGATLGYMRVSYAVRLAGPKS